MVMREAGIRPETVRVTFQLPPSQWASTAHVVGDFNNWDPRSHPLKYSLHNGWRITLELERGRAYQYRFLLNGSRWCNDWNADRYVATPFGGENSVVET